MMKIIKICVVVLMTFAVIQVSAQSSLQQMTDVHALSVNNTATILGVGAHYNGQQGLWLINISSNTVTGFPTDGDVTRIAWNPDNNTVAVAIADQEHTINVYDIASNELLYSLPVETVIPEISWNDTGSQLALRFSDNIDILSGTDGSISASLAVSGDVLGNLADIAWLADENRMFGLLDFESDIVVWDTVTGAIVDTIELPFIVESITLNDTTNQIAAGSAVGDGRIIIIDALSGNIERDFVGVEGAFIRNMVWSPDNQALAGYTGTNSPREDKLMVWNVPQEKVVNIINVSGFVPSNSLVWLNNNTLIFSSNNSIPLEVSPPMAAAGIDQILNDVDASGSELVTLDGSASSDFDGTIVSYEWFEDDVVIATGVNPQVTFDVGVHQVILTVTDDDGATGSDVVTITVEAPPISGGPNQILFSSVTDPFTAATNIFVINPDGTGQTQLTTGNGIRNFPAWSPDGTQILYSSNQDGDDEIFVMNADGTNQVQLTMNTALDRFPVWSPDGTQIAFASQRDGNWEIYTMNADGSNPVNLTNNPSDDFNVSWAPDGSQIAFASLRDGTTSSDTEIYVMNSDGTNVQRLTNSPSIDEPPNWSPDGTQIAFTSDRSAGNIDIYVMNTDGSNVQRLTTYSGTDEFPNWSPDGTQIAFDSNRSSFFNLYFDIHTMNADGTNVQRITTRDAFDRFAAWGYP